MGACASVNNTKTNQIIAPIDVDRGPKLEKEEILKPYLLYPYQLNVSAVEEMQRKYPESDFVEYYLERANQQKNQNGRGTFKLMVYEHPDISAKAPKNLKEELLKEIDSDSASVTLILDKGIHPNESVGKKGYGETVLHYVAKHNNFKILNAILNWIKVKQPEKLDFYLNIPDAEGNIPVMVAAICDAVECVYAFFNTTDSIKVDKKNKAGLSLTDICTYFSPRSMTIIKRFNEGKLASLVDALGLSKETPIKAGVASLLVQGITKKVEIVASEKLKELRFAQNMISYRTESSMTIEDLKLTYQQTLDLLSRTGFDYVEGEFYDKNKLEHNELRTCWKKDYEILDKKKGDVKLLGNVSPYDVLEGVIWTKMLTVIQALACFPSVIRSAFNTKESNPQGLYSITLYHNRIPKEVLMNNVFPIDTSTNKPSYFRTVGKKFWTNVLGKAIAKLHGSWQEVRNQELVSLFANIIPIPVWYAGAIDTTDDNILIENLKRMISPNTITYFYSRSTCKQITDIVKSETLYQLLEIKYIEDNWFVVGKNLFGHDEKMFTSVEELPNRGLPFYRYNGFDEKAIENGLFPLKFSHFKNHVERIYIIPKMLDGKYTYIPIEIENYHAEYFEIEITKEVKGWFKFSSSDPEEAILIQDYDTNPKIICKFVHCNCH